MIILVLLTFFSISFLIKEIDGPFDCIAHLRGYLMKTPIGVFVYNLLECYYCIGWWSGLITYILYFDSFRFDHFLMFGFSGAICSLMMSKVMDKLN